MKALNDLGSSAGSCGPNSIHPSILVGVKHSVVEYNTNFIYDLPFVVPSTTLKEVSIMASPRRKYTSALVQILFIWTIAKSGESLKLTVADASASRNVQLGTSCPTPNVIVPCKCHTDDASNMDMDCSDVTTEQQLMRVFSKEPPLTHYRSITIRNNNHLSVLRGGDFQHAIFTEVFICNTTIVNLEPLAFEGSHDTLEKLDLWGNGLAAPPDVSTMTKLTYLDISSNGFKDFPQIRSSCLQHLDVSNNSLTDVPEHILGGIPALRLLYLQSNDISHIEEATFDQNTQLEKVILNKNKLTAIAKHTFNLTGSHSELDLDDNEIASVANESFTGVTGALRLRNNHLTELPELAFRTLLEEGVKLYIDNNPFGCECDIAWLITDENLLHKLISHSHPTCSDGRPFAQLDPNYYKEHC